MISAAEIKQPVQVLHRLGLDARHVVVFEIFLLRLVAPNADISRGDVGIQLIHQ
jgi:hypothetical protein